MEHAGEYRSRGALGHGEPEERAASVHDPGLSVNTGRTQASGRGEAVGISQALGDPMATLVISPMVRLR